MPGLLTLVTIFLMALVTGVSFSHLLQRGPKAELSGPQFLAVQQALFRNYGVVVGALEAAALVFALVLALGVRARPLLLSLASGTAACVALMIAVWAVWINPINETINSWAAGSMPPNWTEFRDRWHTLHAVRFVLGMLGLGASSALALIL
jgi:hypothetical protein